MMTRSTCRSTGGSPYAVRANGATHARTEVPSNTKESSSGSQPRGIGCFHRRPSRERPLKITSRLFHRTHRGILTDLPDEPDGVPDTVGPACGQPEAPTDAAPLTLSTISSFGGGCAANFRGSLWSTSHDFATQKTTSDPIFLSTACSELVEVCSNQCRRAAGADRKYSQVDAVLRDEPACNPSLAGASSHKMTN